MVKVDDAASRWVPEDDNGNLTDLNYVKGGSSVKRYQYKYDKNGMRDTMIDNDGVHAYAYDAIYQITQATHPTVQNPLEQFTYDSVGNRLTDLAHSAYQFNELNQLLEDDSCKYLYDLDGNMIVKIDKNTEDTTVYTYDIENRLVQVQEPGTIAQYAYDAVGRRMVKTVNGIIKQYRYSGDNLLFEMDGNDSIIADYTFESGVDNPISLHRNGQNYFYVKDGLGSVTALTDEAGNTKHEYKYSVFGSLIEEAGDIVENQLTFTSREWDQELGGYFYRARYFFAGIGRFMTMDPIGFKGLDINLYRFVHNFPVSAIDPYGTKVIACDKWVFENYPKLLRNAGKKARARIAVLEASSLIYTIREQPSTDWASGEAGWSDQGADIWFDPNVSSSFAHELAGHGGQREAASVLDISLDTYFTRYNTSLDARWASERDAFEISGETWDSGSEFFYSRTDIKRDLKRISTVCGCSH